MNHFLIVSNPYKDKDLMVTNQIKDILESYGKKCTIDANQKEIDITMEYNKILNVPQDTDCVIVLGGDGTLIRTAREIMETKIPIMGVNLGTLGYLTDVEVKDIENYLKELFKGNYHIEERMRLFATVRHNDFIQEDNALNEICLTRAGSLKVLSFHLYVNGEYLYTYHADGMIFATPTGSTAYNLSAGGPIVEPGAKMMVLTPICPHSLNTRSIVISDEDQITIEIPDNGMGQAQEAEINFDGRRICRVKTGDVIQISKSTKTTKLIKFGHTSFLETVHKKM